MSIAWRFVLAIALLVGGFALGWYEKGVHVTAGQARQATTDLASIEQQAAKQSAQLQQHLVDEQAASTELLIAQRRLRDAGATLRLEIRHALFTSSTPSCPDPLDSPEFYRLYNAAAAGAASTGGTSATGTGRVHP